jgi:predicted nucleic acid-binding protein
MERSVLVDSSFFIACYRRNADPFRLLNQSNFGYEFYSCGVVMMEVCRGIRAKRLYDAARRDFAVMCWVPTTEKIWSEATELARNLAARGVTMQLTDLVIAASALSADATVLTLDSDFRQVPELQVLDKLEE